MSVLIARETYLNFDLMPLFHILHFSIFVSELSLGLIMLPFSNLPEGVDLISL